MRGSPLWQVLGVLLMFAAAGLPIWRLTSPRRAPAAVVAPATNGAALADTPLEVQVSFAPAPTDFALRYLGDTTVLAGQGPATDFTGQWTVKLPPEGIDLTLQAHWPNSPPGHVAAHVLVRFPAGRVMEKTCWGDAGRAMVEIVTIAP